MIIKLKIIFLLIVTSIYVYNILHTILQLI